MSALWGWDCNNYTEGDVVEISRSLKASAVGVRCSYSWENPGLQAIAVQQFQAHRAANIATVSIPWVYWTEPPERCALSAIETARMGWQDEGSYMILDVEEARPIGWRDGDCHGWLSACVAEVEQRGWRAGIYCSRASWEANCGSDAVGFERLPLLLADYDGQAVLVSSQLPFAGWVNLAGKQYVDRPYDLDIFDTSVVFPCPDRTVVRLSLEAELLRGKPIRRSVVRAAALALG